MRENSVKKALRAGQLQIGCGFTQLRSPEVARVLAAAGFHWTFIDAEHGPFDMGMIQDLCKASVPVGLTPIVRVADMQYALVARALDCGAQGVVFPRVESPELLARAISWTKFPPMGVRGFGLGPWQFEYEKVTLAEAAEHFNRNTMVVLQIETATAVERRDELLSVPGIDAVMIGPVDLSISLGVPGNFEHPKMVQAMEQIRDSCLQHGVAPGAQVRSIALAKFWKERGMKFLGCGNEIAFMLEKASETAAALLA
jgi:2-dehydro-3-deoxyglucarate aldolase/4-hydroxy-2-oxoheptanedioate aldolase